MNPYESPLGMEQASDVTKLRSQINLDTAHLMIILVGAICGGAIDVFIVNMLPPNLINLVAYIASSVSMLVAIFFAVIDFEDIIRNRCHINEIERRDC